MFSTNTHRNHVGIDEEEISITGQFRGEHRPFLNSDLIICNSKPAQVELIAAFTQFRFVYVCVCVAS